MEQGTFFSLGEHVESTHDSASEDSRSAGSQGGVRLSRTFDSQSPLVSIIIVCFRDREEVSALLDNIAPFRGDDLEVVIIDGGSDDGTLQLLQARSNQIDFWSSARDGGIYDAMNKGIAAALGKFVLHLNAGDRLRAIPWETLKLHADSGVDVVCCRVLTGTKVFTPSTGFRSRLVNTWHHQGTFYRTSAHLGYDLTYRVFGDFNHNQRLIKAGGTAVYDSCIVATHQENGISLLQAKNGEICRSVKENYGVFYLMLTWLRLLRLNIRSWLSRATGG